MSELFEQPKTTRMSEQFFGWSKDSKNVKVSGGDATANGNNVVVGKVKKEKEPVRLFLPGQKVLYPYQVSIKTLTPTLTINILRGRWQAGAAGTWNNSASVTGTGGFAYLKVTQDASRNVTEVVSLVSATSKPYVEVVSPSVIISYIPLAEIVTEGDVLKVKQLRYGNFTLGLWQIDGDVIRWTETVGGNLPPIE